MSLPKDMLLENRYRIIQLLSRGGMGAVYQAFDTNLQISVAIKENFFQTPESVRQFEREALMLAGLRHPNLPRVTHHFSAGGKQYLVMDFIEGQDLREIIKGRKNPLDEKQALDYIIQICKAVGYLHQQNPPIIHRDIKPQNIKITPTGQAILVDLGIAKIADSDENRTDTGARGVTPGFSPPEQYGSTSTTLVSDIYALGATFYAVLTGEKPPDSVSLLTNQAEFKPPRNLNPSLSIDVSQAIMHAMQPQRENRPQSAKSWQRDLERIQAKTTPDEETKLSGVKIPSKPTSPTPAPPKPQTSIWVWISLAAVALITTMGVMLGLILWWSASDATIPENSLLNNIPVQNRLEIAETLGSIEQSYPRSNYSRQHFDGGMMFWWDNPTGQDFIFVVHGDSRTNQGDDWSRYENEWSPSEPILPPDCPQLQEPDGPLMGFGKLWCYNRAVKELLGKPLGNEFAKNNATIELYNGGMAFSVPVDQQIWVLLNNGNWQKFDEP